MATLLTAENGFLFGHFGSVTDRVLKVKTIRYPMLKGHRCQLLCCAPVVRFLPALYSKNITLH